MNLFYNKHVYLSTNYIVLSLTTTIFPPNAIMTMYDAFADELKTGKISWIKAARDAVERSHVRWLELLFKRGPAGPTSPRG